jgi:methenyltetrahydrofolate cyclohydrolase
LPRTTPAEKAARTEAIQKQLAGAALVPLEVAECAAELIHYCSRIAEIGNANVLSDIATGAALAASAGTGASWMVRTNLRAMKDLELVNALSERLSAALDTIATSSQHIVSKVGERA